MLSGKDEFETMISAPSLASSKSDLIPRLIWEGEIVFFFCSLHTSPATSKISSDVFENTGHEN